MGESPNRPGPQRSGDSDVNESSSTDARRARVAARGWCDGHKLFCYGPAVGRRPELWNVDHPDRVASLHQQFIDAGADIVLTNSFGGSAYRLKLHQADQRVEELNKAAAQIARKVADAAGRSVIVAGSVGPTGEILEPVGTLTKEDATAAFAEQAKASGRGRCRCYLAGDDVIKRRASGGRHGGSGSGIAYCCNHDVRHQRQHDDGCAAGATG